MDYRDNATPSDITSGDWGIDIVTLASLIGQGSDIPCREVQIWTTSTNAMTFGKSAVLANNGGILPPGVPIKIPISNCNKFHFNGTDADEVYILWRS
jgi:hypothetical protein